MSVVFTPVVHAYSTGSTSFTFPASVAVGDLLVVHYLTGNTETPSSVSVINSSGAAWTRAFTPVAGQSNGRVLFTKTATAADLNTAHVVQSGDSARGLVYWAMRNENINTARGGMFVGGTTSLAAVANGKAMTVFKVVGSPSSTGTVPNRVATDTWQITEWGSFAANTAPSGFSPSSAAFHNTYYMFIVFEEANQAPNAPTSLAPKATFRDSRQAQAFTWTHSDPEGNAQTQYQVQYRLEGATAWTTPAAVSSATASHTFAANTFTLGQDYEWQVRTADAVGFGPWSATATFVAGTSYWTTLAAVASATSSASVTAPAPGPYYWEVRTADASNGFGPWSASGSFTRNQLVVRTGSDSAPVASDVPSKTYIRPVGDSAGVTDVAIRVATRRRSGRDAGTPPPLRATPSIVDRVVQPVFSLTLAGTPGDSALGNITLRQRTSGDSITGPTDTAVRSAGIFRRTGTDTAGATDAAVGRITLHAERIGDSVTGLTDVATRKITLARAPPEPTLATPSDVATQVKLSQQRFTGHGPAAVQGLVAWLNPAQLQAREGDLITTARGDHAAGLTAWTVQGVGPTFRASGIGGHPYLEQGASGTGLRWAVSHASGDSTVFVVSRMRGTNSQRILSGLSNNWLLGFHGNQSGVHYAEGWVWSTGTTPAVTTLLAHTGVRQAGVSTFYAQGVLVATGNGTQGPNGLSTNGFAGTSEFSDADVYEVLVYDRALSPTDRDAVHGYLAAKYGTFTVTGQMDRGDITTVRDVATQTRVVKRTGTDSLAAPTDTAVRSAGIFQRSVPDNDGNMTDAATRPGSVFNRTPTDSVVAPTDVVTRVGTLLKRSGTDSSTTSDTAVRTAGIFKRSTPDSSTTSDVVTEVQISKRSASDGAGKSAYAGALTAGAAPTAWFRFNQATGTMPSEVGTATAALSTGLSLVDGPGVDGTPAVYTANGVGIIDSTTNLAGFAGDLSIETIVLIPQDPMEGYAYHLVGRGSAGGADANYHLYLFGNTSGINRQVSLYGSPGGVWQNITPFATLTPGWHHIVATRSAAGVGALYVDGALQGGTLAGPSTALPVTATSTYAHVFARGGMSELALFPSVLSAAEVTTHYNAWRTILAPTDTAVRSVGIFKRTPTDTVTPTDVATRKATRARYAEDMGGVPIAPPLTGLVNPLVQPVFAARHGVYVGDAASMVSFPGRSGTDSLTTSDAAVGRITKRNTLASDNISGLTDAATRSNILRRSAATDSAPATDQGVRSPGFFRWGADTVTTPTDAAVRNQGIFARTPSDTDGNLSDLASRKVTFDRDSSDTDGTMSDAADRDVVTKRQGYDNAGPTEPDTGGLVSPIVQAVFATRGTSSVYDEARAVIYGGRSGADNISGTADTVTRAALPFKRTGQDSAPTQTDTASQSRLLPRTGADSATVTDTAARNGTLFKRTAADTDGTLTDAAERDMTSRRSGTDTVTTPTDSAARLAVPFKRTGADTDGTLTDSATRNGSAYERSAAEITIYFPAPGGGLVQPPHHSVGVFLPGYPVDEAYSEVGAGRTALDTAGATDSAYRAPFATKRTGTDSASLTDAATRKFTGARSVEDEPSYIKPAPMGLVRPLVSPLSARDEGLISDRAFSRAITSRTASDTAYAADTTVNREPLLLDRPTTDILATVTDTNLTKRTLKRAVKDEGNYTRTGSPGLVQPVHHLVSPYGDGVVEDVAKAGKFYVRSGADTAVATDAVLHEALHIHTGQDTASATDASTRWVRLPRLMQDYLAPVEPYTGSLVQALPHPVGQVGSVGTNDDAARWVANYRRVGDEAYLTTDSAVRYVFRARTATETVTPTDALTHLARHIRALTDTAHASDTVAGARTFFRSGADTVAGTADAANRQPVFKRTAAETVTVTESASRYVSRSRTAADTTTLTEAATRLAYRSRTGTDAVTDTDALTHQAKHIRALVETVTATDTATRALVLPRLVRDEAAYAPAYTGGLVQAVHHPVAQSSDASVFDFAERTATYYRRLSDDSVLANDSATRYVFRTRTGTEALAAASDTLAHQTRQYRIASDTATASTDSLTGARIFFRAGADTVTSTDSAARGSISFQRTATETVTPVESVLRKATYKRALKDDANYTRIGITGLVRPVHYLLAPYGEGISDDSVRAVINFRRVGDDATGGTDSLVHQTTHFRSLSETVTSTDTLISLAVRARFAQDSAFYTRVGSPGLVQPLHHLVAPYGVGLVEDVARSGKFYRRETDNVALGAEGVTHQTTHIRSPQEVVTPSESVSRKIVQGRFGRDYLSPITPVAPGLVQPVHHPVSEFGTPSLFEDAARHLLLHRRTTSNVTGGTDSAVRYVFRARTASETAPASDTLVAQAVRARYAVDEANYTRVGAPGLVKPIHQPLSPYGVGLVDDTVRAVVYFRRLTDDGSIFGDSVAHVTRHIRGLAEIVTPVESVVHQARLLRAVMDEANYTRVGTTGLVQPIHHLVAPYAEGLTDDVARLARLLRRTANNAVLGQDSVTHQTLHIRDLDEIVTVTDGATRKIVQGRYGRDALSPVTPVAPGLVQPIHHPVSEYGTPGLFEDVVRVLRAFRRVGDDGVLAQESVTHQVLMFRSASDSVGGSDTVAHQVRMFRAVTDEANYVRVGSPGLVQPIHHLVAPYGEGLTDDTARALKLYRRIGDEAYVMGDGVVRRVFAPRAVEEVVGGSDALTRRLWLPRLSLDEANYTRVGTPGLVQPVHHLVAPYAEGLSDDSVRIAYLFRRTSQNSVFGNDDADHQTTHIRRTEQVVGGTDLTIRRVTNRRSVRDEVFFVKPVTGGLVQPLHHPVSEFAVSAMTDEAEQARFYTRWAADSTPTPTDSIYQPPRFIVREAQEFYGEPLDVGVRFHRAPREADDVAWNVFDRAPGNKVFARRGDDLVAGTNDGTVRTEGVFRRSAADEVPLPADRVRVIAPGTGLDVVPEPTDSVTRSTVLVRAAYDHETVRDGATRFARRERTTHDFHLNETTDAVTRRAVKVVRAADSLPTPTDFEQHNWKTRLDARDHLGTGDGLHALRVYLARRTTGDSVPTPTDSNTQQRKMHRAAGDALPTTDLAARLVLSVRKAFDHEDPPRTFATRWVLLHRGAEDYTPAYDQGWKRLHARLSEVLPEVTDTATRQVYKVRLGVDTAPATDGLHALRYLLLGRAASDLAPATDSARQGRDVTRTASDLHFTSDSASRVAVLHASSNDDAVSLDVATRIKRLYRSTAEALLAPTDSGIGAGRQVRQAHDFAPIPDQQAHRKVVQVRLGRERVLTPVDAVYWLQSHRVGIGPPIAEITFVSGLKVGGDPDCGHYTVDIEFEFDQPVNAFAVRVNPTSALDGTLVTGWEADDLGFGLQRFGRYPFGRALPGVWATGGTATIPADVLLHGENTIVVYGRGLQNLWSHHPFGEIVAADAADDHAPGLIPDPV